MNSSRLRYSNSALRVLNWLVAEGHRIFSVEDLTSHASELNVSTTQISELIHYLNKGGYIDRVKRGVYSIGQQFTDTPIHEFEIAMALVQPAAISHWSAMRYHNITDQIPQVVYVLTCSKNVPYERIKPITNDVYFHSLNNKYKFIRTTKEKYFGIEEVWLNNVKIKVTDLERTLLDALMKPQYCGGIEEVIYTFDHCSKQINFEKLIDYALKLDISIAKRLGWILDNLKIHHEKIELLKNIKTKTYYLLDASGKQEGNYNSTWKIRENISSTFYIT